MRLEIMLTNSRKPYGQGSSRLASLLDSGHGSLLSPNSKLSKQTVYGVLPTPGWLSEKRRASVMINLDFQLDRNKNQPKDSPDKKNTLRC